MSSLYHLSLGLQGFWDFRAFYKHFARIEAFLAECGEMLLSLMC